MIELSLNGIKKYKDSTLVLKDITFQVYAGEKVGIIGANGSGKSTILKLIAGIETLNIYQGSTSRGYDEGWISITKGATTAYLEQIPKFPDGLRVIDILSLAFGEIYSIESEMRELEDKMKNLDGILLEKVLKQYSEIQQLYEVKGGYDIQEKLNKVCKGLKFDEDFLNKDFSILSGGEKTTVILGKILIENPEILLLDEPTNHLDFNSIEWLENYLKNYKGIVIIVSHDRYFLDNIVTKIIEVEDKVCEIYRGNYSAYIREKEERMLHQFEDFREQQKKINGMEKTIKDLRDWALRADNNKFFKRAVSIQKKLDKMDRINKPVFEKQNMKLNFKVAERSGNETINAVGLFKNFEEKVIFSEANLLIKFGERVAMIGSNGSGKTTFLKMLLKEEGIDGGIVEIGANVKMAYLPQNITFKDEELTILEYFREDISILEGKAREHLSKFMFFGSSVFKKIRHLSGGERIRLTLSKLLYKDINLLILDEPTNHLDIDTIETLEQALEDFEGTIFFISHDRYFINKISEKVIAIENKRFNTYLGNYDYYKNKKDELNMRIAEEPIRNKEKVKRPRTIGENKEREAEAAKTDIMIETLENEIRELDLAMDTPDLNYEELNKLYCRKDELNKELDVVMDLWLSLNN